jgi:hypothetical protein
MGVMDPRMPHELNELTLLMWKSRLKESVREQYRHPGSDEISETVDFVTYLCPEEKIKKTSRTDRPFRLLTIDESMASIERLKERYKPVRKQVRKGKVKASKPSVEDTTRLRQQWYNEFVDILEGTKEELPPLREINHKINLIDPNKKHTYRLPRCPTAMRDEFHTKLNRYINAGWWEPRTASQAAPLMCVHKKDSRLRTVIDARQRNENTVKDVTPLPDQETIREDVARAPIRSKIDLADVYEQVRVRPTDVDKTAFATIAGTFVSHVVQQGDCNAPATFQ